MPLPQIRQLLDQKPGYDPNEFLMRIAMYLPKEDQARVVRELGIAAHTFLTKRKAKATVLRKIAAFRAMTPSHYYCQRLLMENWRDISAILKIAKENMNISE